MNRNTPSITLVALFALGLSLPVACAKNSATEKTTEKRVSSSETPAERKPTVEMVVVPAGTEVVTSLQTPLSTETNHTGDSFLATTTEPILVGDRIAVPIGAQVRGTLEDVVASGKIKGRARMTLVFNEITSAGKSHPISSQKLRLEADSGTRGDIEKIAAGSIAGAIIGGITGGKKGAVIGTAIGAGAGTIVVLVTEGDEIDLSPGQRLAIRMTEPHTVPLIAQR